MVARKSYAKQAGKFGPAARVELLQAEPDEPKVPVLMNTTESTVRCMINPRCVNLQGGRCTAGNGMVERMVLLDCQYIY
eukprot:SAG31_NODE_29626_length_392_cov_0.880546_1_plen_79_part_00